MDRGPYYEKQNILLLPHHLGNYRDFRSSVPGTVNKDKICISSYVTISQIYVLYIWYLITRILAVIAGIILEFIFPCVFNDILVWSYISVGNLPVGFLEIYFCLYQVPGALKWSSLWLSVTFQASVTSSRLRNTFLFSRPLSSCPYVTLATSPKLTPPQNWRAMSSQWGGFLGHTGSLKFSPPPPATVCLHTCSRISRGEFSFFLFHPVKVDTVRYSFPFPLWKWKSLSHVRLFVTP